MAFSDEDLMDYADGVLDEHTTAKIDQAIEDDPSLLDRIEEFRSSFAMAAIADDFAQSTVPSLAEMEEAIAARERGAVAPEKAYGLLEALRARIMVVLVSLSLTFAGGVAATMGFVAWRVQQAVVSFQFPAVAVVRHGLKTRGATKGQDTSKYASDPIWYGKGPLAFNIEVLVQKGGFERRLGYLTDKNRVLLGSKLRINYRIDNKRFLDAQGFWCVIFGSCDKTGMLSIDLKPGKGKSLALIKPVKVAPGEQVSVKKLIYVGAPPGNDAISLKLQVAGQSFERSVMVKSALKR